MQYQDRPYATNEEITTVGMPPTRSPCKIVSQGEAIEMTFICKDKLLWLVMFSNDHLEHGPVFLVALNGRLCYLSIHKINVPSGNSDKLTCLYVNPCLPSVLEIVEMETSWLQTSCKRSCNSMSIISGCRSIQPSSNWRYQQAQTNLRNKLKYVHLHQDCLVSVGVLCTPEPSQPHQFPNKSAKDASWHAAIWK